MEILLLIAIIAVGVSGLYVAATFNIRARQNFTLLMDDAAKNISKEIAAARGELRKQMQGIADQLQQNGEVVLRLEKVNGDLRDQVQAHAGELQGGQELIRQLKVASDDVGQQMQAVHDEVRQNSELVRHSDEQARVQQEKLGADLVRAPA
jgi:Flp pilus assembly protein TadB